MGSDAHGRPADCRPGLQAWPDRDLADSSPAAGEWVALRTIDGARRLSAQTHADGPADFLDRLTRSFERLRVLTSRDHLRERGVDLGFRLEDAVEIAVDIAPGDDAALTDRWLSQRLTPGVVRTVSVGSTAGLRMRGEFAERRGHAPGMPRYRRLADGRIALEAFELHVVEHCNLRCAHCCNMSPFLDRHVLSAGDAGAQCRALAQVVRADVFKIMGGEPLLHPDLVGLLREVKSSGISDRVRLFTNGLLLHRMDEPFWRELDHLTISSYSSAPVPPRNLELAQQRAREFGFVLNVKGVTAFSEVLSPQRRDDPQAVRRTYETCWLRHRCLVVRQGVFFKCTRAAYAQEFLSRVQCDAPPADFAQRHRRDGVVLAAPDLADRLLAYLNDDEPLAACDYCFGGDGPLAAHEQLRVDDVRNGRTRRTAPEAAP